MSTSTQRLKIWNPDGVPFHVEYENPFVSFFDPREDNDRLVASFTLSTLQSKVLNNADIWCTNLMPNALPDWWISCKNAKDVLEWIDTQRDPSQIPNGMRMKDGTVAQVGQLVEFKWHGHTLQGTILEILGPNDLGLPPEKLPKSHWKVSETDFVLWPRALVKVSKKKEGQAYYYGVAIAPLSGSNLRVIKDV